MTAYLNPLQSDLEYLITRFETDLFSGRTEAGVAKLEAMIPLVEQCGEASLLGRALCLKARLYVIQGRHEAATQSAQAALQAFDRLDAAAARSYAGWHAETFRTIATAQVKLGRIAEALPNLEQAVRIAQAGVDAANDSPGRTADAFVQRALCALIRGLVTLGVSLFTIREIDIAIQVYERAIALADTQPISYELFADDIMLAFWNLTDALHKRAAHRRTAGDLHGAAADVAAAGQLLDPTTWKIYRAHSDLATAAPEALLARLSVHSREAYFASMGRHLLIAGRPLDARAMFECQLIEAGRKAFADDWAASDAHAGIAQASLELGRLQEALDHCSLALQSLDRHDESETRATVLLVRATAYQLLEDFEAAYVSLDEHHRIRRNLEAAASQQYAAHMTLRLDLERARSDAESHQQLAATLQTMARVGQDITANLHAGAILALLHRYVTALLDVPAFGVWLLDAAGASLDLAFGIEDGQAIEAMSVALDHPDSLAARAVRERHEIAYESPPDIAPVLTLPGTRLLPAVLFAPLMVAGRVLGVVSVQSDRPAAFSESARSIFRTLCTYVAIGLDNAAAYAKLGTTVDELRQTQAELALRTAQYERLSKTDPLTEIANRRHLQERAAIEIAELKRHDGNLSVVMFDIDHFKSVNDTYGHAAGDAVIQNVARVAKQWVRPVDVLARIGGEEFAVLLPGAKLNDALEVAERIRLSIDASGVEWNGETIHATSSFGVAEFDASLDELDRALNHADAALYAAKKAGRNRVKHA